MVKEAPRELSRGALIKRAIICSADVLLFGTVEEYVNAQSNKLFAG
jgi:hypothetical protein